jgi:hypothetical protein
VSSRSDPLCFGSLLYASLVVWVSLAPVVPLHAKYLVILAPGMFIVLSVLYMLVVLALETFMCIVGTIFVSALEACLIA